MASLTIRDLPERTLDSLKSRADMNRRSLNGELGDQSAGAVSADFEAVEIVDGKAYLNVSVSTNGDLSASTETWQKADIKEAVLKDDGTVTLEIPAPADKGFMILKTRPVEK